MLKELLDYWTHEYTEVVTNGMAALEGAPKKKLFETMKMISSQHLAKDELSMRSWAAIDPSAARAVKRVYKIRTGFLKSIFQELGFGEAEADMRSKTFASFYIWQEFMYFPSAKSEREKLMKRQLEWFCCRTK